MPDRKLVGMEKAYRWTGGRKMFSAFLALLLITAAAAYLGASFTEYAGFVAGVLGFNSATVAWEDRARAGRD